MTSRKISMPEPVHECTQRVLYGDTDAGGVVYNANYLRYFEKGRSGFMRDLVFSYREMEKQGYILPVVESYLRYKAPARYEDLLLIRTSILEIKSVSCRFNHYIHRVDDHSLLVKGFTVHASVSRSSGRLTKLPQDFLDRVIALTESGK